MALQTELESQGVWLFRWRSYLPFAFVPVLAVALIGMQRWPFDSHSFHELWEYVCLGISASGLFIRAFVVGYVPAGTSGRNTRQQVAESLNTSGIYSVVRHPLYLGNCLIVLGAMMVPFEWWLPVLYVMGFWLYYERIMYAEEAFLRRKFGAEFDHGAAETPAFVPRLSGWRSATSPFSFRNVLKREYTGMLVVVLLHVSIEILEHAVIENQVVIDSFWGTLLVCGVAAYLALRTLKRRTFLLETPGR
ncbi:MAG: isoprenylcysteine carboxylmethyltransferase family protein [Planctomycetota bacterium]|nr:isoprenylcysteine carboxylmethyltransferase family protein [Planctomycetota bacterium]